MTVGSRPIYRGLMTAGGSVTFNAPGTWTSPSRLRSLSVSVEGLGGAGQAGGPGIPQN